MVQFSDSFRGRAGRSPMRRSGPLPDGAHDRAHAPTRAAPPMAAPTLARAWPWPASALPDGPGHLDTEKCPRWRYGRKRKTENIPAHAHAHEKIKPRKKLWRVAVRGERPMIELALACARVGARGGARGRAWGRAWARAWARARGRAGARVGARA